eukprot:COSAG01_NODE_5272_length_4367_cov_52.125117_1_plen_154_part_00
MDAGAVGHPSQCAARHARWCGPVLPANHRQPGQKRLPLRRRARVSLAHVSALGTNEQPFLAQQSETVAAAPAVVGTTIAHEAGASAAVTSSAAHHGSPSKAAGHALRGMGGAKVEAALGLLGRVPFHQCLIFTNDSEMARELVATLRYGCGGR